MLVIETGFIKKRSKTPEQMVFFSPIIGLKKKKNTLLLVQKKSLWNQ